MCSAIRKTEEGFTLVEMALVILILGVMVGAAAPIYQLYLTNKAVEGTDVDVKTISKAIGTFRATYGRYPCPAPLTVNRMNAAYGHEDCSDMTATAPGNCAGGFCIEQSTRVGLTNPRVRVGAVPFRALNITEEQAYDGYNNRITYAVMESLMNDATFDPDEGGLEILNDATPPTSVLTPVASGHFLVFSHGKNGAGAYTKNGVQRAACPAVGPEAENCNVLTDSRAVYKVAQFSETDGAITRFDDVMAYSTQEDIPHWQYSPANPQNINDKAEDNVAINLGVEPEEKMHVGGAVKTSQNIMADNLCEYDGSHCFQSDLIGGQLAEGEGMQCPPGEHMVGIKNGAPVCQSEIILSCPNNSMMKGIDANGFPICDAPPCAEQDFGICGVIRTVTAGTSGQTRVISAGDSRKEYYRCRNGHWQYYHATGQCVCVPLDYTRPYGCGSNMSGEKIRRIQRICPAGNVIYTWISNTCECVPDSQTRTPNCPTGFTGERVQERQFVCPASGSGSGHWTGWTDTVNTCVCVPDHDTRTVGCLGNLSGGNRVQERDFVCPAGTWTAWATTSDTCTCEERTEANFPSCPAGQQGHIKREHTLQCPSATWSAWTEVENTCEPIPPVVCHWSTDSSQKGPFDFKNSTNQVGRECDCGDTGQCYFKLGANSYLHYDSCVCD